MPDDKKIRTPDYDPENPRCDQEQLKFLKECIAEGAKGIEKWNKWCKENKDTEIWLQKTDFSKAHLEGVTLSEAHLEGVSLDKANLKGAYLIGANFKEAYLKFTHLEEANLFRAHLEGAQLQYAHLKGAILEDAHLEEANLNEANLEGVDLSGAHLERADLLKAQLQGANLEGAYLEKAFLNGAHLENLDLFEAHLEGANLVGSHMEGTNLEYAYLVGANLNDAHLEEAHLQNANLEGVDLSGSHLEGTKLMEAHLESVRFVDSNLQGADFSRAIVNSATLVWKCEIDRKIKFEGAGLDSMRIYPATKQLLEYNIRRMNWEDWYKEHPKKKWLVRLFWIMSNYGMSIGRIILTFLTLAIIFATIYFICGALDYYFLGIKDQPGIVNDLFVPVTTEKLVSGIYYGVIIYLRSVYFSVVTMTTLGFGDMFANTASFGLRWWLGHFLLIFQVILGYVLLGALVTRFAVLYTAGGPAGKFEKKEK